MVTGRRRRSETGRTATGGGRPLPGPGAAFDGLVVERFLGEGGMGHLLLAREVELDRPVAVKFLRRGLVGDPASERRFRREGRALAAVSHPHVVHVHRVGSLGDWPYLVMELVDGTPLAARIRLGPMPVEEALRVAEQLASALAEVHDRRIAHRDLNPSNVMLRAGSGEVCLIDFGLSKPLDTTTRDSGGVMGTPYYMAPEQVTGRRIGLRADVYSFGATLFEAVAGRPPHEASETPALFHAILHQDAPPLRSLRPEVPRALEVLVARCLSRAPEFRPEDGAALLRGIRVIRKGPAGTAGATIVAEGEPAARPVPRDPSEPVPLLGRAEEIAALRSAVEGAEAGRGSVVLLEGEPGTGKSRLLREAGRAARARAAAVIPCDAAEYPGSPLRALRECLALHARSLGAATPKAILALVREASPGGTGAEAALRWFLDPEARPAAAPARSDLVRSLGTLLRALLRERPALLAVDDAHLLDEASLEILSSAAAECRSWPLVLAVAFRPPALARENAAFAAHLPGLRSIPAARSFVLGPLSEAAVASLVHRGLRLSEEESCRLAPLLHRKSGGNPLYLLECMRLLEEEGRITEDRSGRRLRQRVTSLALPPRLREVALRRTVGLSGQERELLGAASVDPAGLPAPILAACLDAKEREVLRLLQRLVAERGLAARSDRGFRIPHAEIREAIYSDLLPELRSAYHAEAARGLEAAGLAGPEPARLARHWRLGGELARAVPLYVAAARALREAQSPAEGLALIEEALGIAPKGMEFEPRLERAKALLAAGEVESAGAEFRRLAEGSRGPQRFQALHILARHERDVGRFEEALRLLAEARPLAASAEDRIKLAIDSAVLDSKLGREREARDEIRAAQGLMGPGIPPATALQFHHARGAVFWRCGQPEVAKASWEMALALAEEQGNDRLAVSLLSNLSLACEDLRQEAEAISWARKASERAQILGAVGTHVHARLQLADLLMNRLEFEEAGRTLEEVRADLADSKSREFEYFHASEMSKLALATGDLDAALRWAREGLALGPNVPRHAAGLHLNAAEALLGAGAAREALEEARAAAKALEGADDLKDGQRSLALVVLASRTLRVDSPDSARLAAVEKWECAEAAAVASLLEGDAGRRTALEAEARRLAANPLETRRVERILAG